MSDGRLLWKGAMTSRAMMVVLVILVALLTAIVSAAPVLLEQARTATIQRAVTDVAPMTRDLGTSFAGVAGSGGSDPWAESTAALDAIESALPAAVQDVVGAPRAQTVFEIGKSRRDGAYPPNVLSLLADPDVLERVTFVDGRAPEVETGVEWEIAMSQDVAEAFDWTLGERRSIDADDAGTPGAWVTLVGVFTAVDADDPDWAHTASILTDGLVSDGDSVRLGGTAIVAPDDVTRFPSGTTALWWPILAERVTAAHASTLAEDLRRVSTVQQYYPWNNDHQVMTDVMLTSSVPAAIIAGVERGAATEAALVTVAAGPVVVAIIVLALGARLIARRRSSAVRLLLARGASRGWVMRTLGSEALAAGLIGAAVGCGVATAIVGWGGPLGVAAGALFAVILAVVTPVAASAAASAHERADLGGPVTGGPRRRLALELAVLVPSVAVIVLALGRTEPVTGVDAVLIATPIAVAAVATVLALRVLPLVLRAAEAVGVPRSGLVGLLGPARARRDSPVRTAPVLAVVTGVAVTMFAVVFSATVTTGISDQAEAETGADLHVVANYISADQAAAVSDIPGVRAASLVSGGKALRLRGEGSARVWVYGVDLASFADVQSTRDAFAIDVSPLVAAAGSGDGDAVPVIASDDVVDVLQGTEGITTELHVSLDIVAETDVPSPFGNVDRFLLVSREDYSRLARSEFAGGELFIALTPDADVNAVRASVDDIIDARRVDSPDALLAARTTDPVFQAVTFGVAASAVIVAALLGLAVVMTLMLGAEGRGRMLAVLRTLGYRRRGELGLVSWEVTPALLVALPFGVAAGIATGWLVPRALDLTGFVRSEHQPGVVWDVAMLGVVVAGFALLAAVVVVIATFVASRMDSAVAVRSVDEEGR